MPRNIIAQLPGGPNGFTVEHLEGGYQLDAAILIRDNTDTVVMVGADDGGLGWRLVDVTGPTWRTLRLGLSPAELYRAAADEAHEMGRA